VHDEEEDVPVSPPDRPAASAQVSVELRETLELVADTIVELLGFEVVVVNLVVADDGRMVAAAVRGPQALHDALRDEPQSWSVWETLLDRCEAWGRLRFLSHSCGWDPESLAFWVPDVPVSDDPGDWHPDDALFAPLVGPDGRVLGLLSVDVPVDGRLPSLATRRALEAMSVTASLAIQQAALADERASLLARLEAAVELSPVAMALLDEDRRFLQVNAAYCRLLGRAAEDVVGHDPMEFTHPDDRLTVRVPAADRGTAPSASSPSVREKRYVQPDGTVVWGRVHLAALGEEHGAAKVMAQVEDVTERKRAEAQLVEHAHHDALTGLPNRRASMRRLHEALHDRRREAVAVFFCDVDRLKLVNDAHGHAVGDAYLQAIARRLLDSVRSDDVVGRLSGDEFVVIVHDAADRADVLRLADRVVAQVGAPLRLAGLELSPALSIGIAFGGDHGDGDGSDDGDELLARADAAMYVAKVEQRGTWHVYEDRAGGSAGEQLQLRADVDRALADDELLLHYQPIVRLEDGATVAHEALLRWQHPRRGLLLPGQFLDVVLGSRYESPVTDWVLERACLDAVRRPAGERRTSVNVSSLQVGRKDLPSVVARCLAGSGLDAGDLVLELTEDRLLDRADGDELLRRLRRLGVVLAVDDFGTGYAGLGYLARLSTVGILKLDRSFTAALGVDPVAEHLVRSTASLADACGLQLISEGVETPEQADALRRCGVRYAQGYLYGRPAPWGSAPSVVVPVPAGPPVVLPSQLRRARS
jgi:diguanylate cyclase (GGDEF)-like protein/PAS domain S-box-containing protein